MLSCTGRFRVHKGRLNHGPFKVLNATLLKALIRTQCACAYAKTITIRLVQVIIRQVLWPKSVGIFYGRCAIVPDCTKQHIVQYNSHDQRVQVGLYEETLHILSACGIESYIFPFPVNL